MCKEKASNWSVINVDGKSYLFWCNSYAELKASTLVLGAGAAAISAAALMWKYRKLESVGLWYNNQIKM